MAFTHTTIYTTDIRNDAVVLAKLSGTADPLGAAVMTINIPDNEILTGKIGALEVKTVNIQNLAITRGKILDANVTTAKLDVGAVITANIMDLAVTGAKVVGVPAVIGSGTLYAPEFPGTGVIQSGKLDSVFGGVAGTEYKNVNLTVDRSGRIISLTAGPSGELTFALNFKFNQIPAAVPNGALVDFTVIPSALNQITTGTLRVSKNGLRMKLTLDYTLAGNIVTFLVAPATNDNVVFDFMQNLI